MENAGRLSQAKMRFEKVTVPYDMTLTERTMQETSYRCHAQGVVIKCELLMCGPACNTGSHFSTAHSISMSILWFANLGSHFSSSQFMVHILSTPKHNQSEELSGICIQDVWPSRANENSKTPKTHMS